MDSKGVFYKGRTAGMNKYKEYFAHETKNRTLADAMKGADVFFGCSVKGLVSQDMVRSMTDKPIVFAMANPDPEITYPDAMAARKDLIMATGRSDYPNQVNNVLGFPFIFRGALDVRARAITEAMKLAAAHALAELAREPVPPTSSAAYGGQTFEFGPEYIIPKPFDSRVLSRVAFAVAKAACDDGVAGIPITDWDAYREKLSSMTNRSLLVMHNIRAAAKRDPKRIIFADGESDRMLEACRVVAGEGFAKPTLLGQPDLIRARAKELNIDLAGITVIDSSCGDRHEAMAQMLFKAKSRRGYDLDKARRMVQLPIHHGVMLLRAGEADGMVCGAKRSYVETLKIVLSMAELKPGVSRVVGMHVLLIEGRPYVFADTTVNFKPDARQLADIAVQACEVARQFDIDPNVAMLSFSTFGDNDRPEARVVRQAVAILHKEHPTMKVEGEMRADAAVLPGQLAKLVPDCPLTEPANVFVFPDLQSANIAYKLVGHIGNREVIGPLLVGLKQPVHMVSLGSTVDEIVNMAALASYEAGR